MIYVSDDTYLSVATWTYEFQSPLYIPLWESLLTSEDFMEWDRGFFVFTDRYLFDV